MTDDRYHDDAFNHMIDTFFLSNPGDCEMTLDDSCLTHKQIQDREILEKCQARNKKKKKKQGKRAALARIERKLDKLLSLINFPNETR